MAAAWGPCTSTCTPGTVQQVASRHTCMCVNAHSCLHKGGPPLGVLAPALVHQRLHSKWHMGCEHVTRLRCLASSTARGGKHPRGRRLLPAANLALLARCVKFGSKGRPYLQCLRNEQVRMSSA
eukprot:scaffold212227_cov20-Tisochrysis_lutea.AAC.1